MKVYTVIIVHKESEQFKAITITAKSAQHVWDKIHKIPTFSEYNYITMLEIPLLKFLINLSPFIKIDKI